jgi:hypothetical protein
MGIAMKTGEFIVITTKFTYAFFKGKEHAKLTTLRLIYAFGLVYAFDLEMFYFV